MTMSHAPFRGFRTSPSESNYLEDSLDEVTPMRCHLHPRWRTEASWIALLQ